MEAVIRAAIQNDRDGFTWFLNELVAFSCLEGVSLGITKRVISDGIDSLSDRQMHVFTNNVIGEFVRVSCATCHSNIPWSEMSLAYDSGWNCGYCVHRLQKLEDE